MSSSSSSLADRILERINAQRRWCCEYTITRPDYTRSTVVSKSHECATEYDAYAMAMVELRNDGVFDNDDEDPDCEPTTASDLGLEGNDAKHWNNWNSTEVVRHTLESAKALVRMANEGQFDQYNHEVDMDELEYQFNIHPVLGSFVLTAVDGGPIVEVKHSDIAIRDILHHADNELKRFAWKWVSFDDAITIEGEEELEDEEESDEDEEEEN